MSIDINLIRECKGGEPQDIIESEKKRFKDIKYIDDLIELDKEWRKEKYKLDSIRYEYNTLNTEIGNKKKISKGKDTCEQEISKIKKIEEDINKQLAIVTQLANKLDELLKRIGNVVHESVPVSNDEKNNKIERTWGETKEDHKLDSTLGHLHYKEVLKLLDACEFERGIRITNTHSYFLKGVGVLLSQALVNYTLNFLAEHNYILIQTPFFIKETLMSQISNTDQFFKITAEKTFKDMNLITSPEQPLALFHSNEWVKEAELPLCYAGYASCFNKKVNSYNQYEKIIQFCFTKPEDSWQMHETMISIAEKYYASLGLPYRVLNIVSGRLSNAVAKEYALISGDYNLVSCVNYTDYVSRGLSIRCGTKRVTELEKRYTHILNCRLCSIQHCISRILEYYQTPKGLKVPKVLVKYMGGIEFIPYKEELLKSFTAKSNDK